MKNNIPAWALRSVTSADQEMVKEAHRQGRLQIKWGNVNTLKSWAKQHGWSTPLFGFEEKFITKMLETKENFELAVEKSGIEIYVPKQNHAISDEKIRELDDLYEEQSSTGQHTGWGILVEELREIRRAVEAGIEVNIDGEKPFTSWQNFYDWVHERYHMLEDGYDKWVGNDE